MSGNLKGSVNCIDKQLINWLEYKTASRKIGEIHSIFDKVINILSNDREHLFSIALAEVIQSPQMMRTNDSISFLNTKNTIQTGDAVFLFDDHTLKIGVVHWSYSAAVWDKNISFKETLKLQHQEMFSLKISRFISVSGRDSGLLSAWMRFSDDTGILTDASSIYTSVFFKNLVNMDKAIRMNCEQDFVEASYNFVGSGIGLTPSGDDFLLGCLTIWQYFHSPLFDTYRKHNWPAALKGYTTAVSYFMLKSCLNGFVNDALAMLLRYCNEDYYLEQQLERFLKIGSTSGVDMLIGVLFASGYIGFLKEVEEWHQEL